MTALLQVVSNSSPPFKINRLERDRLILSNQKLVMKIARKINKKVPHVDFEDLVSAGNIGMIKAVDRFDPQKARFSTFAYRYINGEIMREIRDKWQPVKIKRSHYELSGKLTRLLEKGLDDGAIASGLGITVAELLDVKKSLSALKTYELGYTEPQNNQHKMESPPQLLKIFQKLPPRVKECYSLIANTRSAVTSQTIALKLGITRGRARDYLSRLLELDLIVRDGEKLKQNSSPSVYNPYSQIERLKTTPRQVFDIICNLGRVRTQDVAQNIGISKSRAEKYCKYLQELQLVVRKDGYLSANFEHVVIEGIKKQVAQKVEIANYLTKLEELIKLKQQVAKMEKELIASGGDRSKWLIDKLTINN